MGGGGGGRGGRTDVVGGADRHLEQGGYPSLPLQAYVGGVPGRVPVPYLPSPLPGPVLGAARHCFTDPARHDLYSPPLPPGIELEVLTSTRHPDRSMTGTLGEGNGGGKRGRGRGGEGGGGEW